MMAPTEQRPVDTVGQASRQNARPHEQIVILAIRFTLPMTLVCLTLGCWAPYTSHGIPAKMLSDQFRIPYRTSGTPLNMSTLTIDPPEDYYLGAGDLLSVTVHGLHEGANEEKPIEAQVMASGDVQLPLVGSVNVDGKNLLEAQVAITAAYADGYLKSPAVNVTLIEKSSVSVLVLGDVEIPGTHVLPKYENDVGHALAAAGGLAEEASDYIEIHTHRDNYAINANYQMSGCTPGGDVWEPSVYDNSCGNMSAPQEMNSSNLNPQYQNAGANIGGQPYGNGYGPASYNAPGSIRRIALRGQPGGYVPPEDVVLQSGDVVVVPSRRHEVFYVVGRLSQTNTVRFTIGNRERELGVGFVLPRDREIDVVTAVAMAGYIDPIESPTTVTVHRIQPDGRPLLVNVDLIAARYDPRETILVEAGDIIYLNPDREWYIRHQMDKIFGDLILLPYGQFIRKN